MTDEYPAPLQPVSVTVAYSYIRKLAGKDYQRMAVQELLIAAGFEIESETDETVTLKVPSNKTDVSQPADIVEEIVRIDGLDNIEIPEKLNISLTKGIPGDREIREHISELLCGMGLQEIITNSIVNSNYYPERKDLVRMLNSLSSELDVMRPSMMESGLEVVQHNCNRRNNDLALFELGNIYTQYEGKYFQYPHLAIWITGNVTATHWQQKEQQASIYYLEGLINNLLNYGGIKNCTVVFNDSGEIVWKWKNQPLCMARKVSVEKLKEFDIKQDVYFAEIYWDTWLKARAQHKIIYKEVPRFPAVQRDLAMVLDKQVSYKQVQDATEQLKLEALQSFGLFDVFESDKLGAGKKSYALSYTFQLQDRTLTDAETEQLMKRLVDTYKSKLNAQIRE
jgi:phenylalanyl-tRNA synthetase beta chain